MFFPVFLGHKIIKWLAYHFHFVAPEHLFSRRIEQDYQKDRPGFPMAKQPFSAYQEFKRYLLLDEIDGVKIITIRRPQAMNAINEDLNNFRDTTRNNKDGAYNSSV